MPPFFGLRPLIEQQVKQARVPRYVLCYMLCYIIGDRLPLILGRTVIVETESRRSDAHASLKLRRILLKP